MVKQGWV